MARVRLTAAQATVRYLANQLIDDGRAPVRYFGPEPRSLVEKLARSSSPAASTLLQSPVTPNAPFGPAEMSW